MQYEKIRNYIREKRKDMKISLNDFAFNCGIEPASLSRFESGKTDMHFFNFIKISKGFNKTPAEFLSEFEAMTDKIQ